jgi:addiction module RelE/StbE family toxin
MYEIFTANSKTEKRLTKYVKSKKDIKDRLDKLKQNPRKANGAHPLHGRLKGKWGSWLGSNVRIIYSINEEDKQIIIEAVGSHKIY